MNNTARWRLFYVLSVILALTGCQKDEFDESQKEESAQDNISAQIEKFITSDETAANIPTATWSAGDSICIYEGKSPGRAYVLDSRSAGSATGNFTLVADRTTDGTDVNFDGTAALFPFNDKARIIIHEDNSVELSGLTFPAEHCVTEKGFNKGNCPMVALEDSQSGNLSFMHTGGLLEIAMRGTSRISRLALTGNCEEVLAGAASIIINTEKGPETTILPDGQKTVTVVYESGIQLNEEENTLLYIYLPPIEFKKGFTITITDINGTESTLSTEKNHKIKRAAVTSVIDFVQEKDNICILENGTFSFTSEHMKYVRIVSKREIAISKDIPVTTLPSTGNIIIIPATDNAPNGIIGKVTSTNDNGSEIILTTGTATLQETFKELRVNTSLDISSYLVSANDGHGNIIRPMSCPTKASGSNFRKSIPIENDYFNGYLEFNFGLDIKIDISGSKLHIFDVSLEKESGVNGEWIISNIEKEFEFKFIELEFKFRPVLIPGTPIYIVPVVYAEENLTGSGKIKFTADIDYKFEHQKYDFSFHEGMTSANSENLLKKEDRSLKFKSIEAETDITLTTTVGGKLGIYDEDLLSFGADLSLSETISFEDEISTDDTNLFLHNPEVRISPGMTATIYCESFLLGIAGTDRIQHDIEMEMDGTRLNTLPVFSKLDNITEGGQLTARAIVEKDNLLMCEEKGFALFEEGNPEPVEHICFEETDEDEAGEKEVRFNLPSSNKRYTAIPYVKAGDKNHYDDSRWVDLGLSVNWARWNVGAESPEETGNYYAWGETEPKSEYTHQNYIYNMWREGDATEDMFNFIYIGKEISKTEYDAAFVKWGDGAQMPDISKFKELYEKCIWEDGTYNNVRGCHVTGPKGNSIFIPYSGAFDYQTLRGINELCYLWCSTLESQNQDTHWGPCPYSLKYERNKCIYNCTDFIRIVGMPIRAVQVP